MNPLEVRVWCSCVFLLFWQEHFDVMLRGGVGGETRRLTVKVRIGMARKLERLEIVPEVNSFGADRRFH